MAAKRRRGGGRRGRAKARAPSASPSRADVMRYVDSEGCEGDIRIAGLEWPCIPPEEFRKPNGKLIAAATIEVAAALARRMKAETSWRIKAFRLKEFEVFADVDVGREGGSAAINLRNRALDFLLTDRDDGEPDPKVFSGTPESYRKKLDNIVAQALTLCEFFDRMFAERRQLSEEESARIMSECAAKWGAHSLSFRFIEGREGESRDEALRRIGKKPWRNEKEFRPKGVGG